MAFRISRVDYYYTSVPDQPGNAYALLAELADQGVNLLAFTGVPVGPTRTQLAIFPESDGQLTSAAAKAGLQLDGPHPALLVQGDDELDALAGIHQRLMQAGVTVYASTGVTDGRGSFGYLLYMRPDDCDRAQQVLGVGE